jgi:hypothetical protein
MLHSGKSTGRISAWLPTLAAAALLLGPMPALADGGVTFSDVSAAVGIDYARISSPRYALRQFLIDNPIPIPNFFPAAQIADATKPWGGPGIVMFDYDNDGDQDLYVTNGLGRANSLYENQLVPSGTLSFVDVGVASGTGATAQDSNGACAGDIDNDGDRELYVTGTEEPNILFDNNGDGTFTDVTGSAGVGGPGDLVAVSCTFGDADGDGHLDLFVSNNLNTWNNRNLTFTQDDSGVVHNDLYLNQGDGTFVDVSSTSGIENLVNTPDGSWTWVSTFVDIDQDGDQDIIQDDMQGPRSTSPSNIRAASRLLRNNGTGQFVDDTYRVGLFIEGGWMGLAFADYDCNGRIDFFSSNLGSYLGAGSILAESGWWMQGTNGRWTFTVGQLVRTPFGWGASPFDYDNDGDTDTIFHGGGDNLFQTSADNPGPVLQNPGLCTADFVWDQEAASDTDHRFRNTEGVAVGDLNGDGFDDITSVAAMKWPNTFFVFPYVGFVVGPSTSPFDPVALLQLNYSVVPNPGFRTWVAPLPEEGDLVVEVNTADNGNGFVQFDTIGSAGIVEEGTINRDGVGAILQFTPDGGLTALRTQVAGSSYASQDGSTIGFGLGTATQGTVDVLWPGGFRNRLHEVQAGERITLPAIPCSFDAEWKNFGQYNRCVNRALKDYRDAGVITRKELRRLRASALEAYNFLQEQAALLELAAAE